MTKISLSVPVSVTPHSFYTHPDSGAKGPNINFQLSPKLTKTLLSALIRVALYWASWENDVEP